MHHTQASRGRWIITIGAIVVAGSTLLQWWQIGGGGGDQLPAMTGQGISDGRIFLMFLAAVASLLLLTLPFATEKPVAIDHPLVYLALMFAAIAGYLLKTIDLIASGLVPFPPQRGLGYWLAIVGIAVIARGIFEMHEERRRMLY